MPYFKIGALLFMLLFPNGCVGTDSHSKEKPTLNVRLLYKGDQCQTNHLDPQAFWIDDPDQFKKTYARLTRHTLGAQQDPSSRVDFSREGILMVTMGQKPTGGYGLELNREFAVISDDTAVLSVSWIEPPKVRFCPRSLPVHVWRSSYPRGHILKFTCSIKMPICVCSFALNSDNVPKMAKIKH
jgi:hypothetical protein